MTLEPLGGPGYPPILYIYVVVLAASWHKSQFGSKRPRKIENIFFAPPMTFGALATFIHSYIIYLYCSISGFLAQELVWEQDTEKYRKYFFFAPPSDIVGVWVPISSSFNPDETCHILVYTIHLCRSTSGFLAQELVWEQDTEKYRKYFFCTPL